MGNTSVEGLVRPSLGIEKEIGREQGDLQIRLRGRFNRERRWPRQTHVHVALEQRAKGASISD